VGSDGPKESCVRWASRGSDGGHAALCQSCIMTSNFWLSMGYNFGCMIASDTLVDSIFGVKLSDEDIAEMRSSV